MAVPVGEWGNTVEAAAVVSSARRPPETAVHLPAGGEIAGGWRGAKYVSI